MSPKDLAARASRRVLEHLARPQSVPCTPAERASYATTRVCAELGYVADRWERDPDGGLVLVLEPRA